LLVVVLQVRVLGNVYLAMTERGTLAYLALQTAALWRFLALVVVPVGFTVDHDIELVPKVLSLIGVAGGVGLLAFLTWRRQRWPMLALAAWWLVVSLGPRFVVRQSEYLNEHQVYLAFIGLWLALASGLQSFRQWAVARAKDDVCADSALPSV